MPFSVFIPCKYLSADFVISNAKFFHFSRKATAGTSGRDGEDLGGYLVILDIGFDWGSKPSDIKIEKGMLFFSGCRTHDVRPLRGARQITADFYGKTKSPHPYGCGPEKLKRSEITYSSLHPGGRADPRRRAYTGCRGHGHTCRSRGGSCRGLPPTADGRGRGGYSPQSRCRGKRAGSR